MLLLVLLVALPLTALAWFGWRVGQTEEARVEQRYRQVLASRLHEENQTIDQYFGRLRRELTQLVADDRVSPEYLRQLVRSHPMIRQAIILDREGELVHPEMAAIVGRNEMEFLTEIRQLLLDRDLARQAFPPTPSVAKAPTSERVASSSAAPSPTRAGGAEDGWYVWYWGRGIHLLYWRRIAHDQVAVLALSRPRWMSELLSALPLTSSVPLDGETKNSDRSRIQLVDSENRVVYQWGQLHVTASARPLIEQPVVAPLASWRLKYFVDPAARQPFSKLPILSALTIMACGLVALVIVFAREYTREIREARQRVNFVNQVSHELKTPLTNIRLYADLLELDLEQSDAANVEQSRGRLQVIVSESQRLSRLITNVLTLARSDRRQLQARPQWIAVDDRIRRVVERFQPALESREMEVRLDLNAPRQVWTDEDFLDQILGNLISNVERHAAQGRWLFIESRQDAERTTIHVVDRGPGIRAEWCDQIFEPFFRGPQTPEQSSETGTGIGLSISRRLARLQGGQLRCIPSDFGTTMELELPNARQNDERPTLSTPHSSKVVS